MIEAGTEQAKQRKRDWDKDNAERKLSYDTKWLKNNPAKVREYNKRWRTNNPDSYKNVVLKQKYGITLEQYQNLLDKQQNRCAICKIDKNLTRKRFCVDHCHITGTVRGLLCTPCNTLLGRSKDNIELLTSAISYLKRFNYEKD